MTSLESLLLDAKQAIMEEHHRRFQTHRREGEVKEAMRQFHLTVACASDLLNDSLRILEQAIDDHHKALGAGPKQSSEDSLT